VTLVTIFFSKPPLLVTLVTVNGGYLSVHL